MNKREEKKKIYFVLSYTGSIFNRLAKWKTKGEYGHISIALNEDLSQMYSFGRLNPYNPFFGGFVHEGIDYGTFKRFKKTKASIYSIEVTEKQHKKITKKIKTMEKRKEIYSFNVLGFIGAGFDIKYRKKNSFYCAEFVKYLIDEANLNLNLPEVVKPMDFVKLGEITLEYKGLLSHYDKKLLDFEENKF